MTKCENQMKIEHTTKVAALLAVRPDLRWTLVANGIEGLANENHNPPPDRTVGEAAERHGTDITALIAALNVAVAKEPDQQFIVRLKQQFAGYKHGCCHGPSHPH